jgi:hypothetical protein
MNTKNNLEIIQIPQDCHWAISDKDGNVLIRFTNFSQCQDYLNDILGSEDSSRTDVDT